VSQTALGAWSFVGRKRSAADPRAAAAALGVAAIVPLGFSDGGYYESTWRWATVALTAAAGIALLLGRRPAPSRLEWVALGSLVALGALMAISASWAVAGGEGLREAERCALYVAALATFLVVVRPATASALLAGVLAGAGILTVFALGQRITDPPPLDPYQGSLLKDPVGYANALGIVLGIGLVLALGFLSDARRWPQRVVLTGLLCTLGTGLVLTSSRGGWLATAAGTTVLLAVRAGVARRRWAFIALLISAVVVAFAVAGRVSFGDRPAYWRAAIADTSDHPALGSGAGTFDDYWLLHRPIPAYVRDAHSLYLETAAELGAVGLVVLLCALGTPLLAARHAKNRAFVATALGGYVAFLVHAGLDWDWEMPVTTLAGLACGAALLVAAGGRGLSGP
jgi:O-antigen ligase